MSVVKWGGGGCQHLSTGNKIPTMLLILSHDATISAWPGLFALNNNNRTTMFPDGCISAA